MPGRLKGKGEDFRRALLNVDSVRTDADTRTLVQGFPDRQSANTTQTGKRRTIKMESDIWGGGEDEELDATEAPPG